ncbi:helix-turn-helix domain-containing protein [Kumtagia ephedrae]|nr:helix-turn-helix domain-containing protein [Mesorhizobium ephedrae]
MQARTAFAIKMTEREWTADASADPPATGRREERIMEVCEAMIDVCAALYSVPSKEMRRTGRPVADVGRVRQIAMYVTHVALGISMPEVGRGFARDRTTVRHACHLIEDMRDDIDFDRAVAMTERVALAAFKARLEV